MEFHLSNRMEALAALVSPGSKFCDVGCDHGYLAISLVNRKIVTSALATDIAAGPLSIAKANIEKAGFPDVIETRLSDGLAQVKPEEAESILIAGMGGRVIMHILRDGSEVAKAAKELILQPQSEIQEVRGFLCEEGYEILAEDMVYEDGKYYSMMKVAYTGSRISLQPRELYFGPCLLEEKHPVLVQFLSYEKDKQKAILSRLEAQKQTEAIRERTEKIVQYLQIISGAQKF